MHRNKSVNAHQFSMIPRADIPRSSFRMQKAYKTTMNASYLIPVFCEEVLPGDTFNLRMTAFARMATPLFPIMDNMRLDSFFFFVPNRLTWENWQRFMGERDPDPDSSISYTVPTMTSAVGGYAENTIFDYFGLPCSGQISAGETYTHSALPFRAYNQIINEWFRSQDLQDSLVKNIDDGPDNPNEYALFKRGKKHDYFTSALPWPQKGNTSVPLPIGTTAPVLPLGMGIPTWTENAAGSTPQHALQMTNASNAISWEGAASTATTSAKWSNPALYADLSAATAATINQLRQAFQIQRLLERDARGGTRYTEIIRSHFGVISPDARLQRPEYLGGGSTHVGITPIPQTSATSADGTDTPQGNLAAYSTALAQGHGFTQSFTEHGYVIGLVSIRADLTYQQGLRRHWSRSTRYDYYFPVFSMLGEQAILSKEIYCDGTDADELVFGYQERWAEYRYLQSEITGTFRSQHPFPLDAWHLSEDFSTRPELNDTFIRDPLTTILPRNLALGAAADGQQFLVDCFFDMKAARPLPMYSVPGMIDHF